MFLMSEIQGGFSSVQKSVCKYCIFAGTSSLVKSQFISSSISIRRGPHVAYDQLSFLIGHWLTICQFTFFFFFKIPVGSFWTVIHKNVKEEVSFFTSA